MSWLTVFLGNLKRQKVGGALSDAAQAALIDLCNRAIENTFAELVVRGDARALAQKALTAIAVIQELLPSGSDARILAKIAVLREDLRRALE